MMAATNRPDILDPALLRPGRFDRQVVVPLPELSDRHAILEVHVKGKRTADDLDLNVVARGTPGMSGADLSNLINEAALYAVREGDEEIAARHVEMARDRVVMGQKRESLALTDDEKEAIAYHEAGHAVCAAVLPTADPLHKVTIILHPRPPRGDVRRPHRRGARVRDQQHRRGRRPDAGHRAGAVDGPGVGHVLRARPDGVGITEPGVPRRGPGADPRLQRRDGPGHRRGDRTHPARAAGPVPGHPHRVPPRADRRASPVHTGEAVARAALRSQRTRAGKRRAAPPGRHHAPVHARTTVSRPRRWAPVPRRPRPARPSET